MKEKILRFLAVLSFFWFFSDAMFFRLSHHEDDFRIWIYLVFIFVNLYLVVQELKRVPPPRIVWPPAVCGLLLSIALNWENIKTILKI